MTDFLFPQGFSPAWWFAFFSRNAFFVHGSTFCQTCSLRHGLPEFSDGGLLFRPTPPGFLDSGSVYHWIHVVGDLGWRPRDGAAGWVSWLYRDDSADWRLATLNWQPARGNWIRMDVGRCDQHRFVENRPALLTYSIHVGDWMLRGAMRGQHLKMGFGAVLPSEEERGVVRSAGYEDGIVMRDGQLQPGPQADIINTMSSSLGFSYSVHPVFPEGNVSAWQRLIDEVANYRLDIGLGLIAPTPALRERVSFMEAQQYVTKYATVRRPRLRGAGFDPGKPFAVDVWWLIVAMLLISSVFSWLTTWLVRRYRDGQTTNTWAGALQELSAHGLQVLGILCQRGVELTTNSQAIGTLFLTLSVFSLLIYNFYTGVMLSYMAVLVPAAPFSSLSAATASGYRVRYQLGSQEEDLLRSNSTALIRDLLAHSSPIVYLGPEEDYPAVAEAATSSSDIILTSDAFLAMDESLADPASCPLCYWPEPVAQTPVSMIGTLHLHNSWMLNRYLRVLLETGVLSRWRRRLRRSYLAGSRLCSTEPETAQYSQLGLQSVAVSFDLLLGGLLLALLLLVVEVVVYRLPGGRRSAQQQQRQQQQQLAGAQQATGSLGSWRDPRQQSTTEPLPDRWRQQYGQQQQQQLGPWQPTPGEVHTAQGQTEQTAWQTEQTAWQTVYTETVSSWRAAEGGEAEHRLRAEPYQFTGLTAEPHQFTGLV